MVEDGPIDVLTGDYLAELTMAILARSRMKDPAAGYARPFLEQMEQVLGTCIERGIKVVANAGGLNPPGLTAAIEDLAGRLGVEVTVATVTGDDLMPRWEQIGSRLRHLDSGEPAAAAVLHPLTANAYLGGWGIAAALDHGADVVVAGRVSDASLVVGPAAWHHHWERDDWDRLAGAVVAGHIIECGCQATGGNYSFFREVPGSPGFPIAEVDEDGSAVITKHPGTGGIVSIGTVTAQLLYEVGAPRYLNPDVVARIDTVHLSDVDVNRVRVSGVRGEPPPPTTKVAVTSLDGYRNSMTLVVPGLDVVAKVDMAAAELWSRLGGVDQFDEVDVQLIRTDQVNPRFHEASFAYLKITVADGDRDKVGRRFSNAVVELALSSYPGFTLTSPPRDATPLVRYWPGLIEQPDSLVTVGEEHLTVSPPPAGGDRVDIVGNDQGEVAPLADGPSAWVPIGRVLGARSGDKGGDANLGVFARNQEVFEWMVQFLNTPRLQELLPECREIPVERYVLANLKAINFVLRGYLGEGVASSNRLDPQAKALGEYFRARVVEVPERLLAGGAGATASSDPGPNAPGYPQ